VAACKTRMTAQNTSQIRSSARYIADAERDRGSTGRATVKRKFTAQNCSSVRQHDDSMNIHAGQRFFKAIGRRRLAKKGWALRRGYRWHQVCARQGVYRDSQFILSWWSQHANSLRSGRYRTLANCMTSTFTIANVVFSVPRL